MISSDELNWTSWNNRANVNCNFFRFYLCRATTEECPVAIIVMSTQSIMGVIIQACMAGIIFAKFTVPRKRGQTLVFSKNAVITQRNGALYLICRVCDLRKSSLLEAHVRMVIIKKEVTDEGETIPYQLSDLDVTTEVKYTSISSLVRDLEFWVTSFFSIKIVV